MIGDGNIENRLSWSKVQQHSVTLVSLLREWKLKYLYFDDLSARFAAAILFYRVIGTSLYKQEKSDSVILLGATYYNNIIIIILIYNFGL